jgi:SPP1 gp7 family putative phage head morphogenesis protein
MYLLIRDFLLKYHPDYANKHKGDFKKKFKEMNKAKLSESQLEEIRDVIDSKEREHIPSSKIIDSLQRTVPKAKKKWKAERIYSTESKRIESDDIIGSATKLGIKSYKVMPSPNACEMCLKLCGHGERIFKEEELTVKGRRVPPFHPNCYCSLIINE